MSSVLPPLPKEEIEENDYDLIEDDTNTDNNNNDDTYFVQPQTMKEKIEKIKTEIPEKKKRTRKMSPEALDALAKAREKSKISRAKKKEDKQTLSAIKEDNKNSKLQTELTDYKTTLLEIHNKNKELESQINELKNNNNNYNNSNNYNKSNNYNNNNSPTTTPKNNYDDPSTKLYSFEEMNYFADEMYKQKKQQEDKIMKSNTNSDIQKLRDRYLYYR